MCRHRGESVGGRDGCALCGRHERERRAEVTRAQGEREAAIAVAEGQKQAAILKAEGQRTSAILEAEGQQQAQELKAQGYAKALQAIYDAAHTLDDKTMALQYMEMLEKVGSSPATKFVLPMELTSMVQNFVNNMSMTGAMSLPTQASDNGNGHHTDVEADSKAVQEQA